MDEQEIIKESAAGATSEKPNGQATPVPGNQESNLRKLSKEIQQLGQVEPDPDAKNQARQRLLAAVAKKGAKKRARDRQRKLIQSVSTTAQRRKRSVVHR